MNSQTILFGFLGTSLLTFFATLLGTRYLIPFLQKKKLGQEILEIGPSWHRSKSGTPTMGGILFLGIFLFLGFTVLLGYRAPFDLPLALTLLYAILNGCVGIADDLTKFSHHQNEGLSVRQKSFLQLVLSVLYLLSLHLCGHLPTSLFWGFGITVPFGFFFYPLAVLLLVGMTNSVNLTDGIDGLATSVASIIFAFFAVLATYLRNTPLLICAAGLLGIMLGFLAFNRHPAKIFMGDTGSLFLGGCITGLAFYLQVPWLSLLVGIFCLWEAISVILQVGYYKLTHKRLFKMAPFHHHLEKCGYSENKIVTVACIVTLIGCIAAFLLLTGGMP